MNIYNDEEHVNSLTTRAEGGILNTDLNNNDNVNASRGTDFISIIWASVAPRTDLKSEQWAAPAPRPYIILQIPPIILVDRGPDMVAFISKIKVKNFGPLAGSL